MTDYDIGSNVDGISGGDASTPKGVEQMEKDRATVDYATLARTVINILGEVRVSAPGRIDQLVREALAVEDPRIKGSVSRLKQDIGEDRSYCRILRVDYVKLTPPAMQRISAVAYLLAKENPDIILPVL